MAVAVTEWTAASNKWKQNLSSTTSSTATSVSTGNTGLNGLANAYPVALSSTRWLWLISEPIWPTAAGQTRLASVQAFGAIDNCVALQVGAQFDTSTLTFYCGPRPGTTTVDNTKPWAYFDARDLGTVRRPTCGVRLDTNRLLVGGMSRMSNANFNNDLQAGWQGVGGADGTAPVGGWATILYGDLDGAAPSAWAQQPVDIDLPKSAAGFGQRQGFHFFSGMAVVDDWLVCWMNGPVDQSGHLSVCRYPLDEVLAGQMLSPYWWVGGERWVPDRENAKRRIRVSPPGSRSERPGAVHQRSDGRWQLTVVPEPFYDPAAADVDRKQGGATIGVAMAREPAEKFGELKQIYTVPVVLDDYDLAFASYVATGQTWSGMASGDQVVVYSSNTSGPPSSPGNPFTTPGFTDSRTCWPKMVQVAGIGSI